MPSPTPLPTATADALLPLPPPLLDNLDAGGDQWQAEGAWTLSAAGRMGDSGLGWTVDAASEGPSLLTWLQPIDLSQAATPRLVFSSRLALSASQALVQLRGSRGDWQPLALVAASADWAETVVDLRAYAGQVIQIRFAWLATTSADAWSIDLVGVDNAWQDPTPVATATEMPDLSATPEPEVTEAVTPPPDLSATPEPEATEAVTPPAQATETPTADVTATPLPESTEAAAPPADEVTVTEESPTATLTPSATVTETPTITASPSPLPTASTTSVPTATETATPAATVTLIPTETPLPTAAEFFTSTG